MPGDATGMHATMIKQALESRGVSTKIYVEEIQKNQIGNVERFTQYAKENRPDDILIYHLAAPSAIADFLSSRNETLVIIYHNITPAHFFDRWDQVAATGQIWARAQLSRLANRTTLALPVSRYNQEELIEMGYGKSIIVPILVDPNSFVTGGDSAVDASLQRIRQSQRKNFLFVGRLVPNKAQHNLIAALSAYEKIYDQKAMLHLVGRPFSKGYLTLLKDIARDLDVADSVNFTLGVSSDQLASYYKGSDALISLSEHEGFCVPLLEAMHHKLPIVAYDSSAISETLGNAGLLIRKNDPVTTAVAMHKITTDETLRIQLTNAMMLRLKALGLSESIQKLIMALSELEPSLGAEVAVSK